jgi:TonB family protein
MSVGERGKGSAGTPMFEHALLTPAPFTRPRSLLSQLLSLLAHAGIVVALFTSHFAAYVTMTPASLRHVTLLFPSFAPPPSAAPEPRVARRNVSPPPVSSSPRLFREPPPLPKPVARELPPEPPPVPAPEMQKPSIRTPDLPRLEAPPLNTDNLGDAVAAAPASARKDPVRVAGFSGVESAQANSAQRMPTQIGGFGAAAAATKQTPSNGLVLPRGGGFSGVESASARTARGTPAAPGSFGTVSPASGRAPSRGEVARAGGFSQAAAALAGPVRNSPVSKGGFEETIVVAPSRKPEVEPTGVPAGGMPVEILSKPRPAYSDEARRLKIEGEVLVELLFSASGEARVVSLIRGLGHGLDENALAAAQAIRFRPAKRGEVSVDATAIVHIVFQLAY